MYTHINPLKDDIHGPQETQIFRPAAFPVSKVCVAYCVQGFSGASTEMKCVARRRTTVVNTTFFASHCPTMVISKGFPVGVP